MSTLGSLLAFAGGACAEAYGSVRERRALSQRLDRELLKRGANPHDTCFAPDRVMFDGKVLCFRPRMVGAVAAYIAASGRSRSDIIRNGGMDAFRMLWFLAAAQDDLIDAADQAPAAGSLDSRYLMKVIFGKHRTFYRAAFRVVSSDINRLQASSETKTYLRKKVRSWYRFLVNQEAEMYASGFEKLSFSVCAKYREQQNSMIGGTLVALLNGAECLVSDLRRLEEYLPIASFRTQIIDDVADIAEDLRMRRPSYCMGALNEYPVEMARMRHVVEVRAIAKVRPWLFKRIAPRSYALVRKQYAAYGVRLRDAPPHGVILDSVGNVLFHVFPSFRDVMYRLSPRLANF